MKELRVRGGTMRLLGSGAVAVVALASSGCTSSGNNATSASSTTTTTRPATVTKTSNAPRTSGYVGARKDVTDLSCKQDGKLWKVAGKVTNPTDVAADYRVFTSFLDQANDTRGLLQTDVDNVPGGATKAWSGDLELSGTGLYCGLRVERTGVNGGPTPPIP